jgi:hypothetical protein
MKLLGQHKTLKSETDELRARLEAFQEKEKNLQEESLIQKQDWQKLKELKDKEVAELKSRAEQAELKTKQLLTDFVGMTKKQTFEASLPAKLLSRDFLELPMARKAIESIIVDPETGEFVEESINGAVKSFLDTYGMDKVLDVKAMRGLPGDAPRGGSVGLTVEQWNALPLKDRKARMHEVKD